MMRELRGISVGYPGGIQKITLTTRGERGNDYDIIKYTGALPLNRGRITAFLHDYYKGESSPIKWPGYLKIPEV